MCLIFYVLLIINSTTDNLFRMDQIKVDAYLIYKAFYNDLA